MRNKLLRTFSIATLVAGSLVNDAKSQPPMDPVDFGQPYAPIQACDPCFPSPGFYYQPTCRGPIRTFLHGIAGLFEELANLGSCNRGVYWNAQPHYFAQPGWGYGFQQPYCCGGLENEVIYGNEVEIIDPSQQPTPALQPNLPPLENIPSPPAKKSAIPKTQLKIDPDRTAQVSYRPNPENQQYPTGSGMVVSEASASGHRTTYVIPAPIPAPQKNRISPPADGKWHAVKE